jgi:hypothetical protein
MLNARTTRIYTHIYIYLYIFIHRVEATYIEWSCKKQTYEVIKKGKAVVTKFIKYDEKEERDLKPLMKSEVLAWDTRAHWMW